MNRAVRRILLAATLVLPLGGCGSMPDAPDFDPTEWLAGDWFGTKKPLPGQRKELFPGGVPGVSRGVPTDLVKGNQPPTGAEDASADTALVEEPKAKPKPKAKPRPKVAAKPAPAAPASKPTSVTVRRADQPPPQQQPQQQQQQQQQSNGVQWPDPPPPVQHQGAGAVQWPDPPPPPR
jgi:hypothetical protein